MGQGLCSSKLTPENYPPTRRFMRQAISTGIEDGSQDLVSSSRMKSLDIHVMSYNVLADQLALTSYHTHASSSLLDFSFRGPRIVEEIR